MIIGGKRWWLLRGYDTAPEDPEYETDREVLLLLRGDLADVDVAPLYIVDRPAKVDLGECRHRTMHHWPLKRLP